jgi:hypothetical protein
MARFSFQVKDGEGKLRSGTMEARNLEDARSVILKRGFEVIDLKELAERGTGQIQILTAAAPTRYRSGPAAPRDYRSPIVEAMQERMPSPRSFRFAMALLAAVGMGWMVVGWRSAPKKTGLPGNRPLATASPIKVALNVTASLVDDVSLGDVEVVLDLPEIPYQQTFLWAKLNHPGPRSFTTNVTFESTRQARQLIVRARKPGYGSGER